MKDTQIREERDWLLRRADNAGKVHFGYDRMAGVSSNALARYAVGGEEPTEREYPGDIDDLRSCLNAFESSPRHLRSRMVPVLRKYSEHVMESLAKWYPPKEQS